MKELTTIVLLLIGHICMSQEMLVEKVVQLDYFTLDTVSVRKYTYNNDYQLTQRYSTDEFTGDTTFYIYNNDTLIYRSDGFTYEYFNDSVVKYEYDQINDIYYLNEADEVVISNNWTFNWSEGNMIMAELNSVIYHWDHDFSYSNPWYNENKNLKLGIEASIDMPFKNYRFNSTQSIARFIVLESIEKYPTIIEFSNDEWEVAWYYHFYYHDLTNIYEQSIKPYEVLSISYYNLLGQEIEKPKKGFFIERKITNKGIDSKKYYQY